MANVSLQTLSSATLSGCDEQSETAQCPICIDTAENPITLFCGHTFCRHCIQTWLSNNHGCPLCRRDPILHKLDQFAKKHKHNLFKMHVNLRTFSWYERWLDCMCHYVRPDWLEITPEVEVVAMTQKNGKSVFMAYLPWDEHICDAGAPERREDRGISCNDPACLCHSTITTVALFEGDRCELTNGSTIHKGGYYRYRGGILHAHGQVLHEDIYCDCLLFPQECQYTVGSKVTKVSGIDKNEEGVVIAISKDGTKIRVLAQTGLIWRMQRWTNYTQN